MLTRILAALAALPLFFLAVYFTPPWVLPVALALLSGLAAYEMLHNTGMVKCPVLLTASVLLAAAAVLLDYFLTLPLIAFVMPAAAVIFTIGIFSKGEIPWQALFGAFFSAVFLPLAFGAIGRIQRMDGGDALILVPFIAAWGTDTCAYFAGRFFGKHKLAPIVSPKKTVEGAIGGVIGCILLMIAYAFAAEAIWDVTLSLPALAVLALVGSVISQIGDLSMSYIKRGLGIKDYGKIMPGHGGILDRFDSVLFTAPFTELLLMYITVVL
ncbi:MAG: phosphatidate cytidylyltransferase [Ruminococcaceae bacterium]|nr:phosphatidate cytidylyltransferase [Oscillospiraceae bacterium]